MILVGAVILIGEVLIDYTLWQTWLLYGIAYLVFDFMYEYRPRNIKKSLAKSKSFGQFIVSFGEIVTTHPFFLLLLAILLTFGARYFI